MAQSGQAAPLAETDTDTQLAILASLLEPASYPLEELLDALTNAKGDVTRAAESLLLPRVKSAGKRKAGTSLESWLGRKKGKAAEDPVTPEKTSSYFKPAGASPAKKPAVDLLSILQQPEAAKIRAGPLPPLPLATQSAIDKHGLPLTILQSPLSPAFASALYLALMEESENWERHRWFLAGKWVESPHTMTSFARDGVKNEVDEAGWEKYYYSGTHLKPPLQYPALLKLAAEMVEPVVNASLAKRKRYPLEYAGSWRANVCGANRYDGAGSGVGWHADQLTYLGPYTTIASLSLGTRRGFRLRQTDAVDVPASRSKPTRTYEIELGHNSLVTMNAGCQERFKHTIPTQKALDLFRPGWDVEQVAIPSADQKTYTSRINITFRFYRDDFHPSPQAGPNPREGTPHCKCGIPALLRADQKAKVRARLPPSPVKVQKAERSDVVDDDMVFFWQCQSPGQTGDMKGCGFFRILDIRAEGRGPCLGDVEEGGA